MKRILLTLVLLLWAVPALAQVPMTGAGKGTPAAAPTYQGPVDIVASPKAIWDLRAVSTADRGNRLINICDPSNVTCADWSSDATTGKLVVGTNPINGTDCTVSTTCTIKIWYDRSGALNCAASAACDLSQATAANRPTFTWACINTLPCIVFTNTQSMSTTTFTALTQTYSASAVGVKVSGTVNDLFVNATTQFGLSGTANSIRMFAGSGASVANVSDTFWHALQGVFSGATSTLFCGGSQGTNCSNGGVSTTVSPGTGNLGGGVLSMGPASTGSVFNVTETAVWPIDITSSRSALTSNQIAFWGPF